MLSCLPLPTPSLLRGAVMRGQRDRRRRAPCFTLVSLFSSHTDGPDAPDRPGLPAGRQRGTLFPQSPRSGTCRSDQATRPPGHQASWPAGYPPRRVSVSASVCALVRTGGDVHRDGPSIGRCPSTKTSDPETALNLATLAALSRFIPSILAGDPCRAPPPPQLICLFAGRSFSLFDCTCIRRVLDGGPH
jgi:hypothetical protein